MKCAIYARVSTINKGQDNETQLMPLREYCQRMKWDWEEFKDMASGVNQVRPEFNAMLARLRRKEFDVLLVWKLDRLERSLENLIKIIDGELSPRNIQFISLTENFDTTTPGGKVLYHIIGALAEFEHDMISERVKAGIARTMAQGNHYGRKRRKVDIQRLLNAYKQGQGIRPAVRIYNEGLVEGKKINPGTALARLREKGVLKKNSEI